jgi:PAS domain S-box-containing protein
MRARLRPVWFTLALLVGVQLSAFIVADALLTRQEGQRQITQMMFAQRARVGAYVQHTQLAFLGLATSDWERLINERRNAEQNAAAYEEGSAALHAGGSVQLSGLPIQLPALDNQESELMLHEAQRYWQGARAAALIIFRGNHLELRGNPNMAEFLAASGSLTRSLNDLAARSERRSAARNVLFARAVYGVRGGSVLLAIALCLFLYRLTVVPLGDSIRARERSEEEARLARDELENSIREHTAELVGATQALRETQLRLQGILDNTSAVIYVKGLDGRYLLVNRQYERLFHVSGEEMRSKTDFDLFPHEMAEALRANDRQALHSETPIQFEERVRHDDGEHCYVTVKFALFDAEHRANAVCGISTDLTELKRAEEQLRHAQKMEAIGRLSGGIAHDFNNLLTVINGYSAMLLPELDPAQEGHLLVSEILKAGERAAGLTQQLLAYSRKQVLEPRLWNLNAIVADMTHMIRRLIGEDISFVTAFSHDGGLVEVDRGQVEQIILNLVVNGRDAMPNGGKLTLETGEIVLDRDYVGTHLEATPGPHLFLAVSDTGCGMPPEVASKVFEPFFTTKEVGKGTGLGLSVVFGIVKQSGGSISVYSEVGHGSTFRVYFPEAKANAEEGTVSKVAAGKELLALSGTETVLLVEDEEPVRSFVASVLKRHGYVVLEARNGVHAIDVFKRGKQKVDLVVTDVVMPEMGGPALIAQLRALEPSLAVLYISGYAEQAVVHNGIVKSRQSFLHKPFSPLDFSRKVREVLNTAKVATEPTSEHAPAADASRSGRFRLTR